MKYKEIFILCPENFVSGGPDALHQLQYYMRQVGVKSKIVYYNGQAEVTPQYAYYQPNIATEVIDDVENLIIIPESSTRRFVEKFKHAQLAIWWLGVGASDCLKPKIFKSILSLLHKPTKANLTSKFTRFKHYKCVKNYNFLHFCGSKYAYEYVNKYYGKAEYLVEPISKHFYDIGAVAKSGDELSDSVVYNPSKPSKLMTRLLENKSHGLHFCPVKGMSTSEVAKLFNSSKLYIDFGRFDGPERMPKESVYNGAMLLVGKRNAAKNDFDVAIPDKFKIKNCNNPSTVIKTIHNMLCHYDEYISEFLPFREKIVNLEKTFKEQISKLFN